MGVANYLNNATIIRGILINEAVLADEEITPLSLLLAIGNQFKGESQELKAIRNYLIKRGMNFRKTYCRIAKISESSSDIAEEMKNYSANIYAIKPYYKRYFVDGYNVAIPHSDIAIARIIANLIERDFTNSMIVENALNQNGIHIDTLKDIDVKIKEQEEYEKKVAY